jgi:hypothetical protein
MTTQAKLLFGTIMTLALSFGFLHSLFPDAPISFKRLHVFLFNLLTGGSLILYYTEGRDIFTRKVQAYFSLALLYTLSAASSWYIPTLIISAPLFIIVESIRIKKYSWFPADFFSRDKPTNEKFNHASLLCLSMGIVIASLVILNNEYLHLVAYQKLALDVFFLGYSFPISLITMSVMFSFMNLQDGKLIAVLKEFAFWSVNLGVIVFFLFIIFDLTIAKITIATTLFFSVFMIFFLFLATAPRIQQKTFLISGMVFLLFTALTGIFYILVYYYPALARYHEFFLLLHAMVSLYGWNLTGLFVIIRWNNFPIKLNSALTIVLHWLIVLLLAPLGIYILLVSILAVIAYVILLLIVFAGRSAEERA